MHPRHWPLWAWAALAVVAAALRLDLLVGDYSGATAVALYAGCLLPARRAGLSQALALPVLMVLGFLGAAGTVDGLGFALGRPATAALAAWLLARDGDARVRWASRLLVAALLLVAAASAGMWQEPAGGMQMKTYYAAVSAMAVAIAFYYSLRLVRQPSRVFALIASLAPYYAVGVAWALLVPGAGTVSSLAPGTIVFHGLVTHLPGDVLTSVVVAFFARARGLTSVGGNRVDRVRQPLLYLPV